MDPQRPADCCDADEFRQSCGSFFDQHPEFVDHQ
jgi:hypothetical protein